MARSRRLALAIAVAGALVVPALVACNSLIGLDAFDKTQCSGARCDAGPLPDVAIPDASADVKLDAPKGADPVSWARWPMPNYDGGADAGLPNPLSYGVNGDQITDNVTKLVWRADLVTSDLTLDEAVAACAALSTPTETWRMPKRIELVTLLDFGRASAPLINQTFKVKSADVWTSSEVRPFVGGPEQAYWTVSFRTGVVTPQAGNQPAKALCVKAK